MPESLPAERPPPEGGEVGRRGCRFSICRCERCKNGRLCKEYPVRLNPFGASRADGGKWRIMKGLVLQLEKFARSRRLSGRSKTRRIYRGLIPGAGRRAADSRLPSGTVDATRAGVAGYSAPWRSWTGHEVCGDSAWRAVEFQEVQTEEGALLAPVVHPGRTYQSPRHPLSGSDHGHPVGRRRGKSRPDTCSLVHPHQGQYAAWNTW